MFLIFQTLERNILSEGKMIGVGWGAGADDHQEQKRKCDQREEKSDVLVKRERNVKDGFEG